jgi:citrate synthase
MGFPVESMNAMGALRLGTNLMRQEFTYLDSEVDKTLKKDTIGSDEDSIAMETAPRGEKKATFEIKLRNLYQRAMKVRKNTVRKSLDEASGIEACKHLIAGVATITAAISRAHQQRMPLEPDPNLSHAGNLLYMITGKRPSSLEERIMDVALILHADHGMNASTFATMVVASTLSDFYFSVGSGIAALNGPLHGGANEQVIKILNEIGSVDRVKSWVDRALSKNNKISGFGHRVYKAYDPRARILGPLAEYLVRDNARIKPTYDVAKKLEDIVVAKLGKEKKIFPNVDFYSGIVYSCLGIPPEMFTPIFAVSRVAGWTARTLEYKENNRIFRPRALYTGEFNKEYIPPESR